MNGMKSYILADSIVSPLGLSTAENVANVLAGRSSLARYEQYLGMPVDFVASLFSDKERGELSQEGLTFFESVAARSVSGALAGLSNDCREKVLGRTSKTVFILSTTKANVSQLAGCANGCSLDGAGGEEYILPSESAERIARRAGLDCDKIVVCNACISGLSAIILANRLLGTGQYDYAVVCGCDVQSDFIMAGFHSFRSLSPDECRPFDIERLGLNLGEAAATIVLGREKSDSEGSCWAITGGAMSNDAYHISAPSKKGVGLQQVLRALMDGREAGDMAMINAHGTATMFNDQMEGIALRECGLTDVPVTGLKGYFGHTMGAAGVLETIVCMHCVEQGVIPGTRGFSELGVSAALKISSEARPTDKTQFIKLLSGFGGCNAGIVCALEGARQNAVSKTATGQYTMLHRVIITPDKVTVDGEELPVEGNGGAMLTQIYKARIGDYPKFYKMDNTCRLGFIASELLLKAESATERTDRGVILFNRHSTTDTDRKFYSSILDRNEFYPSPSVFVYTLPNILTGEIAIRNLLHGETCHYLLSSPDQKMMQRIINATFAGSGLGSAITGWVDYTDDSNFTADVQLIEFNRK